LPPAAGTIGVGEGQPARRSRLRPARINRAALSHVLREMKHREEKRMLLAKAARELVHAALFLIIAAVFNHQNLHVARSGHGRTQFREKCADASAVAEAGNDELDAVLVHGDGRCGSGSARSIASSRRKDSKISASTRWKV